MLWVDLWKIYNEFSRYCLCECVCVFELINNFSQIRAFRSATLNTHLLWQQKRIWHLLFVAAFSCQILLSFISSSHVRSALSLSLSSLFGHTCLWMYVGVRVRVGMRVRECLSMSKAKRIIKVKNGSYKTKKGKFNIEAQFYIAIASIFAVQNQRIICITHI